GGTSGYGTVFKLDAAGTLTTLHSFNGSDVWSPSGLIQARDGSFYGTTAEGGASGNGTVFKMDATGTLTTLHSFSGSDGTQPRAGLIQACDGRLYGTTSGVGTTGAGVIFRLWGADLTLNAGGSGAITT